jgi:hypothetical protein
VFADTLQIRHSPPSLLRAGAGGWTPGPCSHAFRLSGSFVSVCCLHGVVTLFGCGLCDASCVVGAGSEHLLVVALGNVPAAAGTANPAHKVESCTKTHSAKNMWQRDSGLKAATHHSNACPELLMIEPKFLSIISYRKYVHR